MIRLIYAFSKHSRQMKTISTKEKVRATAVSDDKSGKIAKAEQEAEQKQQQENLKRKIELEKIRASQPKIWTWHPYYESSIRQKQEIIQKITPISEEQDGIKRFKNKVPQLSGDVSSIINAQFNIKQHTYQDPWAEPKRTGVIGVKVGMTAVWDKWGYRHALTVIQLDNNQVVQIKTPEKDGYSALQIGAGDANIKKLKKPQIGHFMKVGLPPKNVLYEFRITPENALPIGYMLTVRHFTAGQYVDVRGISVGKGYSGTIKRHNFNLQPKSHGNSLCHRMLGSTGQRQDPGRVFKGKKMPGQLGNVMKTVECVQIYKLDADRQLIYLKGSVPGKSGNNIQIFDSIKGYRKNDGKLNYPTLAIEQGKDYAREITMEPPDEDPELIELHENDFPQAGEDTEE